MTQSELEAKFGCLTQASLSADQQQQIIQSVMSGMFLPPQILRASGKPSSYPA